MVNVSIKTESAEFTRALKACNRGFVEVYGENLPCLESPPIDRYVIQIGNYARFWPCTDFNYIYEMARQIGEQAACSLKYSKRKSIRLGKVYNVEFIIKRSPLIVWGEIFLGWKATVNVSKEERRTEG